jgi:2-polyprenyl-3-methyl-5-hydroxy-6-metoxy-1,4-benzoquinol methylase
MATSVEDPSSGTTHESLDLCEAEQSELARRYVLTSELYVDEPWSHAGPRSVSPFAPCAASRLPHVFAAARLSASSVLWDLGCGDGRILHEAAARYGCRCVGVEIDAPASSGARLARRAWATQWRANVDGFYAT